jgi:hypothetical protein
MASRIRIAGFLDVVTNKSPDVVRIYLPPDANCLLSGSKDYYNVIVSDKQPHLNFLDMDAASSISATPTRTASTNRKSVTGPGRHDQAGPPPKPRLCGGRATYETELSWCGTTQ